MSLFDTTFFLPDNDIVSIDIFTIIVYDLQFDINQIQNLFCFLFEAYYGS